MPEKIYHIGKSSRPQTTATRARKDEPGKAVLLNARPDRIDLRDRTYLPKLVNLPDVSPDPSLLEKWVPAYRKLILDQGEEGACTGFGLSAVINYLIFRETKLNQRAYPFPLVSAAMLYRLARIYDEWPGDDYDGSSCRGAMKGWHKHGVCSWDAWPFEQSAPEAGPLTADWETEAQKIPLGGYYRVERTLINDMQSAIHEVGALYVSAEVHEGWSLVPTTKGGKAGALRVIPLEAHFTAQGGHAFALVGYTPEGFIIQNSWGPKWGHNGFAVLTYADWLKFGTDAWVAVMGAPRVPTAGASGSAVRGAANPALAARAGNNAAALSPAAGPAALHPGFWNNQDTLRHTVVLGNNGMPERRNVAHRDGPEAVHAVAHDEVIAWAKANPGKTVKIALYAHGGLNSEEASLKRVSIMGPWFEANGIFPLFFTWKTGVKDTLGGMLADAAARLLPFESTSGGVFDRLREFKEKAKRAAADARDRLLESICSEILARAAWTEMKTNAAAAGEPDGGISLSVAALQQASATLQAQGRKLELHFIGHSAGSILLGHAIPHLTKPAASLHLYAPACTIDFANAFYLPAMQAGGVLDPAKCPAYVHNLDHPAEIADTVGPYGKSLVYLICRALEPIHKTPILGMEAAWKAAFDPQDLFNHRFQASLQTWRQNSGHITVNYYGSSHTVNDGVTKETPKHGTFDNDIAVLNETITRILGKAPTLPVKWLAGF